MGQIGWVVDGEGTGMAKATFGFKQSTKDGLCLTFSVSDDTSGQDSGQSLPWHIYFNYNDKFSDLKKKDLKILP